MAGCAGKDCLPGISNRPVPIPLPEQLSSEFAQERINLTPNKQFTLSHCKGFVFCVMIASYSTLPRIGKRSPKHMLEEILL